MMGPIEMRIWRMMRGVEKVLVGIVRPFSLSLFSLGFSWVECIIGF